MGRDPEVLAEDEAVRLWRRAAELQAEAAQKSETSDAESAGAKADGVPREGYALAHVRAAAVEAGISVEFVDAALADLRAERALPQGAGKRRLARWFLHNPPEAITVRRVIEAPAPKVISAMEAVFPGAPYRLTLSDQQGDPLEGGVLVFDIQGFGAAFPQGLAAEAGWAGYRQVLVSLRPIDGARPSCEVTLRAPVARSQNLSTFLGAAATLLGSGGGAAVVAGGVAVTIGPIASVLPGIILMAGGAMASGGLFLKGFRKLYRHGIGRGRQALEGLLGAIAGRAQGGWGGALTADEPPSGLLGLSDPLG